MNKLRVQLLSIIVGTSCLITATFADQPSSATPRSFFADRQAHRPGDLLTVMIVESASATTIARTKTAKSDSASASLGQPNGVRESVSAALGSNFSGGGEIERSGKLLAKLGVVVQSIDAHGNLMVMGEQEIVVNNEKQRIHLEGLIRPEDITADNTVPSWRVSQARINFTGKGLLARKQSPGLITHFLSLFGIN